MIQADRVYEAIDWPVIVLLGALLPVADAMGSTGAADLVARTLLDVIAGNNTLILGPGGFRFGDYWRLGLPLEILVAAISIPLLLIVWPLYHPVQVT